MKIYPVILYISIALFVSSIILWYISGIYLKKDKPVLSKQILYTGGFMFSFSILGSLIALIMWASS